MRTELPPETSLNLHTLTRPPLNSVATKAVRLVFAFLYSKWQKFDKFLRDYGNVAAAFFTTPPPLVGFIVSRLAWEELRIRAHLSNQPQLVTGRRLGLMNGSRRIHDIISTAPLHCGSELCVVYREEQEQLAAARMRCLSHASKDGINKDMLTLGTSQDRVADEIRNYQQNWTQRVNKKEKKSLPKLALRY